jgi:FAD binding domain-containing protein/berberine-like enzyme
MTGIVADDKLNETLEAGFRGRLIGSKDPDYDTARALFNAMIDKRPRLVAQCADAADVIAAVKAARDADVPVAIRGGGHNGPGLGSVDDGLVIDLSQLRGVIVDPDARIAHVLGGTLLGEVDHATQPFGLVAPFGIISTTGVGGLTLGGGVGNLTRTLGLSIDNLLAADVVLADGSFVTASEDRHDDLFWALRGGGGNFGVVTRFAFRLAPIPTVVAGPMLWPVDRGDEILAWYRDFIRTAPDELNAWFGFMTVPPADPFPPELQLQKVAGVVFCWTGDPGHADVALAAARSLRPALDGVMPLPPAAINGAFDPIYPAGDQWYWRSHIVTEIADEAVAQNLEFARTLPTWKCTTHLYPIDGAAARVDSGATAWPNREGGWVQVIVGVDPDPANAALVTDWARSYSEALQPHVAGPGYVNMMMDEGEDRVRATYGPNYDRLARVKAQYDPDNVFHVNQNIKPA